MLTSQEAIDILMECLVDFNHNHYTSEQKTEALNLAINALTRIDKLEEMIRSFTKDMRNTK